MERIKAFFKVFVEVGEQIDKNLQDGDWDKIKDSFTALQKLYPILGFLGPNFPDFSLLVVAENRMELEGYLKQEFDIPNDKLEQTIEEGISLANDSFTLGQRWMKFYQDNFGKQPE